MNQPRIFHSSTYLVFAGMLLLYIIGPVGAQNTVMEVDGDQTVNKTATVKENLKVYSSDSSDFITGNDGDAWIKDQLEVDGNVSLDGNTLRVDASNDAVGIGMSPYTSSYMKLTVVGAIILNYIAGYPTYGYAYGSIYANCPSAPAELYVRDGNGTFSLLSSHKNPALLAPERQSSFDDPSVALPFSFHHGNGLIGKGAVVDLSALVADIERQNGKSYTTVYDLPAGETETLASYQARQLVIAKQEILSETPEIEIPIQEAWENAEVREPVETTRSITQYGYDLNSEQVTAYQVQEKVELDTLSAGSRRGSASMSRQASSTASVPSRRSSSHRTRFRPCRSGF